MTRKERLTQCLTAAFQPEALVVEDQSALHAGHVGARPEGETHYHVRMVAAAFAGLSRVARHRQVMEAVAAEFSAGLHALSLELAAPAAVDADQMKNNC
ncbi:MAG: BolA family protein [Alphaproteobacteria bacterium]